MNYLSVGNDAKTVKGEKQGYLTGILYLSPAQEAGGKTLCPFSTAGCRAVCLYTAGRGAMKNVQDARLRKTRDFLANPDKFVGLIREDIELLVEQARKKRMIPAVRLNGTTDIEWEKLGIMDKFPDIQFYDYTKWPAGRRMGIPKNYHLTYSFSEKTDAVAQSLGWEKRGCNTAVVFSGGLPDNWRQRLVIDGDLSDLRFLDPKNVIVGLKTKGKARGVVDAGTGFVQLGKAA